MVIFHSYVSLPEGIYINIMETYHPSIAPAAPPAVHPVDLAHRINPGCASEGRHGAGPHGSFFMGIL